MAAPAPLVVQRMSGDRYAVTVRQHRVIVDQPGPAGPGAGPTPLELFAASLASCIAFFAGRALRDESAHLAVRCTYEMAPEPPARVVAMDFEIEVPAGTPPARLAAVERAARQCTVANTLAGSPLIRERVRAASSVAA